MSDVNIGDKVKIKERQDWPTPPGYRLAGAEGTVLKWAEWEKPIKDFKNFRLVRIDNAEGEGKFFIGRNLFFRIDNLEKK